MVMTNNGDIRAENVIVMGAAGRDFHNFNVYFRDNPRYRVVGFTAAQIPNIDGRIYPAQLAGARYPDGIPIYGEDRLTELIRDEGVELVAFSYSDIRHIDVMHHASRVAAAGADFVIIGATYTMLDSKRPVVSVCGVRTGCGKSQVTRRVCRVLRSMSLNPVVVRHPMPYGDLTRQVCQRFASRQDVTDQQCTIEEREEFEPLVDEGLVVYAGIDYQQILDAAESEADIIVWDGGNNDTPFYKPDVHIVVFDSHRAGHELAYHPGETNLLMADIAIINKVDTADPAHVDAIRHNIERYAANAEIVLAESPIVVDTRSDIEGKRVLAVEDGPTITHGEMPFGAATLAAQQHNAKLVDPRPTAVGSVADTFAAHPHIGVCLPAVGYSEAQIEHLRRTINQTDCDVVLFASPIDLPALLQINKPALRVRYGYQDHGSPTLEQVLIRQFRDRFLNETSDA